MATPAEQLKGMTLSNGWFVEQEAARKPNATGGYFSKGYVVVNKDGKRGFLKALDYTRAMTSHDPPQVLLGMTKAFIFEKELCAKCNHLSRISRAVDSGGIATRPNDPFSRVDYLIFELADGDVRSHLDALAVFDVVFVLKTLHHVASGLAQLHRASVAHQDLKPSNVLVFKSSVGSKICDLGRAWSRDAAGPHDHLDVAGDRSYAPIERLYPGPPTDELIRRFGCDVYHLGNLIAFLFTRVQITALLIDKLIPDHRPFKWGDTYANALPFVQAAFDEAVLEVAAQFPIYIKDELQECMRQLCNPDPTRRGHPRDRGPNQLSLERYISLFDRLAHKARLQLAH